MVKKVFLLFLSIMLIAACNESESGNGDDSIIIPDSIFTDAIPLSQGAVGSVIEDLSSPIEMAMLIKKSKIPFSVNFLAKTTKVRDYSTNFDRALALGVFGADLGYLNIYEKNTEIVRYIGAIKDLSEALSIGQFFDFKTLKELAVNSDNLDSLRYLSVSGFNRMDYHLRERNRNSLSALIITGTWIEGLYIATQVVKEKNNPKIAERIGEQKLILNQLLLILANFKSEPRFDELLAALKELKETYKAVAIKHEIAPPEKVEKDGMLIIVQKEKTTVEMTDEQKNNIINKVEQIRNKLIGTK